MNLRRQPSRKISNKRKTEYRKRQDRRYLTGRTYKDYQTCIADNPMMNIVQMDTVYNDRTDGPFLQTFKFIKYGFLFAVLHEQCNCKNMIDGVDLLENILGTELFRNEVNILLADRGSEFVKADELETCQDDTKRTRVFYCDPMQLEQKGSLENKHIELCYILPKKVDLKKL